jgi:hypothetical protein
MAPKLSERITSRLIDNNPADHPAYPMRQNTGDEHKGMSWERPVQQPADLEILHSNERPNLTAVFGTSTPPSGVSGMIRRFAFQYNESNMLHWVPLMLADRVNVVEGIIHDLARGHMPRILREMGIRAEIKHNPKGLVMKATIAGLIIYGVRAYFRRRA